MLYRSCFQAFWAFGTMSNVMFKESFQAISSASLSVRRLCASISGLLFLGKTKMDLEEPIRIESREDSADHLFPKRISNKEKPIFLNLILDLPVHVRMNPLILRKKGNSS